MTSKAPDRSLPMFTAVRSAFISAAPYTTQFGTRFTLTSPLRPLRSLASHRQVRHASKKPRPRRTTAMKDSTLSEPAKPTAGVVPADLRDEMTRSYMEYAMSVILGRAMPDVRDGFKPVHRRILFAMHQLGLSASGPFRKSARVVGEVLGKYHPHGDVAVYDALVRMAQPFSMSVPLVNGHGNFGSTDGDPPAAMRYTECKLTPLTRDSVLSELDRETVSFNPNFDGSEQEPLVLPVKYPNLLVNGSSGIAVGMATNIPPHNLGEIVRALIAIIHDPLISDDQLFKIVPAPDFPTGGQILGTAGPRQVYETGRGRVVVRACVHPEILEAEGTRRLDRDAIIVTQLPYQVNKAMLVMKIANLVNEKKLDGVSDLRDESDRNGTRIVIELKRDAKMPVVLNHLFKKTQLQSSFSANIMALDNGRFPKRLSLRECLTKFLAFRRATVRRRVSFDLKQAENRLHLLKGFVLVQANLDAVVKLIRAASESSTAREELIQTFDLSEKQASAILDMQLRRLTALEVTRLEDENAKLTERAQGLRDTLADDARIDGLIVDELSEIGQKFATERRSSIIPDDVLQSADIDELSLLSNDHSMITVTRQGYIKRMVTSMFVSQNRGGRGKRGIGRLRVGDKIAHLFTCMAHDSLIAVSSRGTAYHLEAHKVPSSGVGSRGVPIFQLLPSVAAGETMTSVLPVSESSSNEFLVLLTRGGFVKKVPIAELLKMNSRGKKVISLEEGDRLKWVKRCREEDSVMIVSRDGYVLRFRSDSKQLRSTGRTARGVIAMRLGDGDALADMDILPGPEEQIGDGTNQTFVLTVTRSGLGKRVGAHMFRAQRRAGRGLIGMRLRDDEQGPDCVVAAQACREGDSVMVVASDGTIVRTNIDKVPVQGRFTRGVRMQRLGEKANVAAVAVLSGVLGDEEDGDGTIEEDDGVNEEEIEEEEDEEEGNTENDDSMS